MSKVFIVIERYRTKEGTIIKNIVGVFNTIWNARKGYKKRIIENPLTELQLTIEEHEVQ